MTMSLSVIARRDDLRFPPTTASTAGANGWTGALASGHPRRPAPRGSSRARGRLLRARSLRRRWPRRLRSWSASAGRASASDPLSFAASSARRPSSDARRLRCRLRRRGRRRGGGARLRALPAVGASGASAVGRRVGVAPSRGRDRSARRRGARPARGLGVARVSGRSAATAARPLADCRITASRARAPPAVGLLAAAPATARRRRARGPVAASGAVCPRTGLRVVRGRSADRPRASARWAVAARVGASWRLAGRGAARLRIPVDPLTGDGDCGPASAPLLGSSGSRSGLGGSLGSPGGRCPSVDGAESRRGRRRGKCSSCSIEVLLPSLVSERAGRSQATVARWVTRSSASGTFGSSRAALRHPLPVQAAPSRAPVRVLSGAAPRARGLPGGPRRRSRATSTRLSRWAARVGGRPTGTSGTSIAAVGPAIPGTTRSPREMPSVPHAEGSIVSGLSPAGPRATRGRH